MYVKDCDFETDDYYFTYMSSKPYFILVNSSKATILGNRFLYTGSSSNRVDIGIRAFNSDISVKSYCTNPHIKPCPEVDKVPNIFENLNYGLYILGGKMMSPVEIDGNEFINNQKAVFVRANSPVITRNSFDISQYDELTYGLFMDNCTGYQVEENNFVGENFKAKIFGLIVRNSGLKPNEIYKNSFSNLYMACEAQGINGTREITSRKGGLQFLCNTFDNNMLNIFVTKYTPEKNMIVNYDDNAFNVYSDYGIAEFQGSKELSAGNKFIHEYEYDIANYQAPIYYFVDKLPNSKPRYITEESVFLAKAEINKCPSHLGNGNLTWSDLFALKDSIGAKRGYLDHLIDVGNTEDVLYEISAANPGQANKLRKALLSISPDLSDTSMVSSIAIETVLPPVMLAQILSSNARAAKSGKVLNALTNRTHPLPPPFMADVMEGRDSLSHHEAVASNLGSLISEKNRTLNEITRSFRNDTLTASASDSLILLLTTDNSLQSDYMLMSYYLYLLDLENAEQILLDIPQKYELSNFEEREYQGISQIVNIQIDLFSQDKTYEEIDSIQKQVLYNLSEDSIIRAGAIARNILSVVDSVEFGYGVVIPIIDTTGNKGNSEELPILCFELSPNPAEEYFLVDYQLPTKTFKNANFVMYNSKNQKVYVEKITRFWYQLLVETDNFEPGFYVCKLYENSKELSAKSIIIKQDEMTAEQTAEAEKSHQDFLNNVKNKEFEVFPNPASDKITVKYDVLAQNVTITIVDNSGKVVRTVFLDKNSSQKIISVSDLSQGIYFVNLVSGDKIISSKSVVVE